MKQQQQQQKVTQFKRSHTKLPMLLKGVVEWRLTKSIQHQNYDHVHLI